MHVAAKGKKNESSLNATDYFEKICQKFKRDWQIQKNLFLEV
jgi:hypothetical protein